MEFLIFVIVLALIGMNITKANNKAKESMQPNRPRPQQPVNNRQTWGGQAQQPQQRNSQAYVQQNRRQTTSHGTRQQAAWNNKSTSQGNRPQMQNNQAQQPDIVQRAVANNARFEEDTTREAIEAMHGHSEAEHKVEMEHSRNCQTLGKDSNNNVEAESQSMFGSVEDLIAMGYSGNLEFERDFLGEGLDMINNF
ncbi:hypothetical protein [Agathobacter sp.]